MIYVKNKLYVNFRRSEMVRIKSQNWVSYFGQSYCISTVMWPSNRSSFAFVFSAFS